MSTNSRLAVSQSRTVVDHPSCLEMSFTGKGAGGERRSGIGSVAVMAPAFDDVFDDVVVSVP
jgi:hypothetical protein